MEPSHTQKRVRLILLCLFLASPGLTHSDTADATPGEELGACLAANVPKTSSSLSVTLESRDRAGREYEQKAQIYWKKSSPTRSLTLVCMTSPRDVRGLTYVVHADESDHTLWVYLPEEERTVRINTREAASRGRIARTAISYEDIRYLPLNLSRAEVEKIHDSTAEDGALSVVRLALPPGRNSLYERVTASVDRESCVPLRIEFEETGAKTSKVVTADRSTITREGKTSFARSMRVEDLDREVTTVLVVEKIAIDEPLPDRIFEPMSQRGRCPELSKLR
jgi:hypothetical protein